MSRLPVIVVGAGGHASVVADALIASNVEVLGFTDADANRQGSLVCGLPVLGKDAVVLARHDSRRIMLVNGIGNVSNDLSPLRMRVQLALEAQGWRFSAVIHPHTSISRFATLEPTVQIMAGCVVQANVYLGIGVILNTSAAVDHDTRIGKWSHIAPGAVICGNVSLGSHCHVGAGAVIKQGLKLGPQSMVGAGAAVIEGFVGNGILVGVPARQIGFCT